MIPYNPSSFDTNKTILEQILELKKWLQAHPSYEIFYSSEAGNTSMPITSYDLTAIADSTNMEVGDVVIFHNVTVGVVTSIDRDNNEFGCDTCVSFKGDTGAQGNPGTPGTPGTPGANGISITNVTINNSYELICTLSDGNTINAGKIWYGINTTTNASGTLTVEQLDYVVNKPFMVFWRSGTNLSTPPIYGTTHGRLIFTNDRNGNPVYSNIIEFGGDYFYIEIEVDKNTGAWTRTIDQTNTAPVITVADIDSESATSGQVLTANGSGGASWDTISGGANTFTVLYSSLGSPLSDSDYAQAVACDVLKVDYGSSSYLDYVRDLDDSTKVTFIRTYNGGVDTMTLTKGTKTIANTIVKISGTSINSGSATSGQVLTADGSGGSSWQTAGGGGTTLYLHNYRITFANSKGYIKFSVISTSSTALTTYNDIFTAYANKVFYGIGIVVDTSNVRRMAEGIYITDSNGTGYFSIYFDNGSNTYGNNAAFYQCSLYYDDVYQIN